MSEPFKVHLHDQGVDAINVQYSLLVDDNVLVQFNTFSDLTAEQVREAVERYLATAPAPAGEREAFEAYFRSSHGDGNDLSRTDGGDRYNDSWTQDEWDGFQAGSAWQARASSPAPAPERCVPGGPACPTCGFKITVGKKPPLMIDDDPAPALDLTSDERETLLSVADYIELVAGADKPLTKSARATIARLTGSADGEGGR